ncbi:interferon-induced protein 44-like isoform X2 [Acanthopagrus latus]|uniref:interferon-induced protein 44-like isoform X2 n=1 Tax=Acanthopagrus latus TaxID=8177 RepID=UPI00187BF38B|nr:interferon-induced protein 44-like isoform X2 [Acanthopagrus latus]XP_036970533.1 interferon-induced protein 44-like isoform X2 [Acanthopagrus latus]
MSMCHNLDKHNIVKYIDCFQTIYGKALVFESLDISLFDYMEMKDFAPMLLSDIRTIIQQMATAFDALKGIGVIHTDVKLDNIMMVNHHQRPFEVKLIDFGLAIPTSQAKKFRGRQIFEIMTRTELMESIQSYKPSVSSVSQVRVLLIGPVGAGKSSFFNSINSVFRGHVTNQAMSGSSTTSLTTQFRSYSLKAGREGKPLPIILCDTMGLEENAGSGLATDDISNILKGHLPDRYQFNPSAPLHSEAHGYCKSSDLKDKIHCVAYVTDACKVSIMPKKMEEKLEATRKKVNLMGIPQLVLLTKVDEACPLVTEDVRNIYRSYYIRQKMQEVSTRLGVPLSCVVPVKNYSEELELDPNCDILLLCAVQQMLRFADNYFDDISDQLSNMKVKE